MPSTVGTVFVVTTPTNPKSQDYQSGNPALDYINSDNSIEEIILSGGEPLLVKDKTLETLIKQFEQIPHLKRLRIHTRLPIVIPERFTTELVSILKDTRLNVVTVLHCNHANEIDDHFKKSTMEYRQAGLPLLNQSVLLRGVNNSTLELTNLSKKLFHAGILPYYLHLLDRVSGTAHFNVKEEYAIKLMTEIKDILPGYLVPKLVREVAGKGSKQIISL